MQICITSMQVIIVPQQTAWQKKVKKTFTFKKRNLSLFLLNSISWFFWSAVELVKKHTESLLLFIYVYINENLRKAAWT